MPTLDGRRGTSPIWILTAGGAPRGLLQSNDSAYSGRGRKSTLENRPVKAFKIDAYEGTPAGSNSSPRFRALTGVRKAHTDAICQNQRPAGGHGQDSRSVVGKQPSLMAAATVANDDGERESSPAGDVVPAQKFTTGAM